jgi:SAM-dependent methyltransferase
MPVPTSINYGQVASGYDKSRCVEPGIADALVAGLRSLRAQSVLEIGAGTGNYTDALTKRGLSVVALDRSPAMIEIGADKTSAHWILSDASSIPLRTRSVDAIVAVNVLHHLSALPKALAEFRRVARAGAVLQAVVRENLATLWYRHYFPEMDDALLPLHPTLGALSRRCFRPDFPASRWRRFSTPESAISHLKRRARSRICSSIRISAHRPQDFDGWRPRELRAD